MSDDDRDDEADLPASGGDPDREPTAPSDDRDRTDDSDRTHTPGRHGRPVNRDDRTADRPAPSADRDRPDGSDHDRPTNRDHSDRSRPVNRDDRDRTADRSDDGDRTADRPAPSADGDRSRPGNRDDRPTDPDRTADRSRPVNREDRDRPADRDRTADRDRPDPSAYHPGPADPRGHPPERWAAVGPEAVRDLLARAFEELAVEYEEAATALEYDHQVTPDRVTNLRLSLAAVERVVEAYLARLADDVEPWQATADRVPDDRLAAALDLDPGAACGSRPREDHPAGETDGE